MDNASAKLAKKITGRIAKTLTGKQIDKMIENVYYRVGDRVEIPLLKIGECFKAGRAGYDAHGEAGIEPALVAWIAANRRGKVA